MIDYFLATFDTTHNALKFEKIMKNNNIKVNVIPMPRELTANCGLAIMFIKDSEKVRLTALENQVMVKAYYDVFIQDNKKVYKESV